MFKHSHKKEKNWYDTVHCLGQFQTPQSPGQLNYTPFIPASHACITEDVE